MDRLWSPWRYQYLTQAESASGCIFCDKPAAGNDAEQLIVHRGLLCFVLLNLYPYTSGHMMVAPYTHVASLAEADDAATAEMMALTKLGQRILRDVYNAPGFNLGMNIGSAAGAGVVGHIHMHLLPRWTGDANFMTTVGETRVIPEALPTTYEKLSRAFAKG
jgi:ATP adenylyltransferase